MAQDLFDYPKMVETALRGVMREALARTAREGLPGDHHFYVTFRTHAPGVGIPNHLLGKFPDEMTIVLQHQFWDLVVTEEGFEVGVSFSGIPERLAVPFAAIKGFFDPSVQFGLQFEEMVGAAGNAQDGDKDGDKESDKTGDKESGQKIADKGRAAARPPAEHKGATPAIAKLPTPANPEPADPEPANPEPAKTPPDEKPDKPTGGGEVVRLDRFRKK